MDWETHGIRVVRAAELDGNTPQTPGMTRAAAITHASAGADRLWAGNGGGGSGCEERRAPSWGTGNRSLHCERPRPLPLGRAAGICGGGRAGDFIYVPPFVPHQEINARRDEPVEAVVVRSGQEPVVINLDIESPEPGTQTPAPFHPDNAASVGAGPFRTVSRGGRLS